MSLDALASLDGVRTGVCSPASSVLSRHSDACRPSRRTSFPSFGDTTGPRNHSLLPSLRGDMAGLGLITRFPNRDFFRGDNRFSQVPGDPQFPFAHGLRPRPTNPLRPFRGDCLAPATRTTRASTINDFRGSIARLSGSLSTYHGVGRPSPRKTGFRMLVRLFRTGFLPAGFLQEVSNSHHARLPPLPSFLGTIVFS